MTAAQAKEISFKHSERMIKLYNAIEKAAKEGSYELAVDSGMARQGELEVLKKSGFKAGYEISETDGGQYILISWKPSEDNEKCDC